MPEVLAGSMRISPFVIPPAMAGLSWQTRVKILSWWVLRVGARPQLHGVAHRPVARDVRTERRRHVLRSHGPVPDVDDPPLRLVPLSQAPGAGMLSRAETSPGGPYSRDPSGCESRYRPAMGLFSVPTSWSAPEGSARSTICLLSRSWRRLRQDRANSGANMSYCRNFSASSGTECW